MFEHVVRDLPSSTEIVKQYAFSQLSNVINIIMTLLWQIVHRNAHGEVLTINEKIYMV